MFDGDWRFDLQLSPKRRVRLRKETPTGYSGYAAICRVKFIPISGYRPDDPDIKLMSQSDAIEVWLVSLRGPPCISPIGLCCRRIRALPRRRRPHFRSKKGGERRTRSAFRAERRGGRVPFAEEQMMAMRDGLSAEEYRSKTIRKWLRD